MKKILVILFVLLGVKASAYDFSAVCSTGQTLYYNITSDSTVEVTYPNYYSRYGYTYYYYGYSTPSGALSIPDSVNYGINTYVVNSIAYCAFIGCSGLISIEIPNSVTLIGGSAFKSCSSLTNVIIPNSVTNIGGSAFYGCSSLTNVIIPNSVTYIGGSAFYGCSSLDSLFIGISVTHIGSYSFYGCSNLSSVAIPNTVTKIDDYTFYGCTSLDSISIGSLVDTIGAYSFCGCISLSHISIPNSVISIGNNAFRNCSALSSLEIPDSVEIIGESAFSGCSNLDSIYIGCSVSSIPQGTFSGCSNIHYLQYNARNCVCHYSINNVSSENVYSTLPLSNLSTLIIGDSVQTIPSYAFKNCYGLTNLQIPDNVTIINIYAFYGCSNLESLQLGSSVSVIGAFSFNGCNSLENLIIPNSVTSIYYSAFGNCSNLDSLYIGSSITDLHYTAFEGCDSIRYLYYNAKNCICHYQYIPYSNAPIRYASSLPLNNLNTLVIGDSVQTIPQFAFQHCTGISNVIIPNSVISIGQYAFYECTAIDTLSLGLSLDSINKSAFEGCVSLDNLYLPNSVIYIGDSAFVDCTNLRHIHMGSSIRVIDECAFRGCSALTNLNIPDSVMTIGDYAFDGCLNLDSLYIGVSVSSIPLHTFNGCDSISYLYYNARNCETYNVTVGSYSFNSLHFIDLDTLILGDSVVAISNNCFRGCAGFAEVIIPNSTQKIGNYAFYGCRMAVVILGENVDSIGMYAFFQCNHIKGVLTISSEVHYVGNYAFADCDSITNLQFAESSNNITLGDCAFAGCDRLTNIDFGNVSSHIGENAFANCTRLSNIDFGERIDTIGDRAFYNCYRLNMSNLSDSLRHIGSEAFNGCTNWSGTLRIPSNVTQIGQRAFANCPQLDSLIFGESISQIGENAFVGDTLIRAIVVKSITPPTIYANTFRTIGDSIPVYIPCNTYLDYYITDYWENFVNLLEMARYRLQVASSDTLFGTARIVQLNTCSDSTARIQALPIGNYHFTHWSDGNTENPRYLVVTQDTHIVAYFSPNIAAITVHSNDSTKGLVTGGGSYMYNNYVTLTANSIGNNHFLKWNDGSTQNPRYLLATQDTSFTAIFVSNISTITVLNSNPTMGTVSGSGNYYYQSQITVSATPVYGYHFVQWTDGNTSNPRNVTVVQDSTFTAQFSVSSYSIVANSDNTARGTVTGGGTYNYNSQISLAATPNYGYHFVQWNDGITNNPRLLTVTRDSIFTAQFSANSYTITAATNDPTMGSAYGSGTYSYNGSATLSATATYGYHFVQWSDGNTDNPRLVTVIGDATYTAQFAINTYTLTVNSGNPAIGSAAGGGTYNYNTPVYISATANYGYHFSQWNDGNTDNPRLVTVTQNATYTAQFSINSYAVSVSSNNSTRGSVTGSGTYTYNTTATITAIPFYGYHFVQWSDGNTDNPRTFTVTQDATFIAQFDLNSYSVTALSSNVVMGSVTGGGTYSYMAQVSLEAVPSPHHHFVQWSDSIMVNPRTILLTQDTTLTAQFAINTYHLTCISNDTTMGIVTGGGEYECLTQVTMTAIANEHHHFVQWSDGSTMNPRLIMLTSDSSFIAQFEEDARFSITATSNNDEWGTVSGSGSYYGGEQVTLTATPNEHYRFVQWGDGNVQPARTIQVVSDASYMAIFEEITYTVNVTANDPTMGSVTGGGVYTYGTEITITAQPFIGYEFRGWSDGDTNRTRTITVTEDANYQAIFQEPVGIDDVETNDYIVFVESKTIHIKGVEKKKIAVYDISGRRIAYIDRSTEEFTVAAPVSGVYLIQVEDMRVKKVVVH